MAMLINILLRIQNDNATEYLVKKGINDNSRFDIMKVFNFDNFGI